MVDVFMARACAFESNERLQKNLREQRKTLHHHDDTRRLFFLVGFVCPQKETKKSQLHALAFSLVDIPAILEHHEPVIVPHF